MTVGYYDGLPAELVTPRTQVFRAMALVRVGAAQNWSGKLDEAEKSLDEAEKVFRKLRTDGDTSEPVTYGLALALFTEGSNVVGGGGRGRGTTAQMQEAADLLRPLISEPGASRQLKQLYADTLNYLSHTQPKEQAVATCEEARAILVSLGALDLSDLNAASSYADTGDSQARHLLSLGRIAEAQKLEAEVYAMADKVLAQRPGDLHSLADRSWAAQLLGRLANRQHDQAGAAEYAQRTAKAGEDEVRFNPSDVSSWQRWALGLGAIADGQVDRGEISAAIETRRALLAMEDDPRRPSSLGPVVWFNWIALAILQTEVGDTAAATQSVKNFKRDVADLTSKFSDTDVRRKLLATPEQSLNSTLQGIAGDTQAALAGATAVVERIEAIDVAPGEVTGTALRNNILRTNLTTSAQAAIRLRRYEKAETAARKLLAVPADPNSETDPQTRSSRARALLANAIAMQGRTEEAQEVLAPALAFYRDDAKAGASGTWFLCDYAYALYVSALTRSDDAAKSAQRKADLDEAARIIDGVSPEAKRMASVREIAALIAGERG
jgi:tetratricopeptide (TPR) repeat protein